MLRNWRGGRKVSLRGDARLPSRRIQNKPANLSASVVKAKNRTASSRNKDILHRMMRSTKECVWFVSSQNGFLIGFYYASALKLFGLWYTRRRGPRRYMPSTTPTSQHPRSRFGHDISACGGRLVGRITSAAQNLFRSVQRKVFQIFQHDNTILFLKK